jgi:hypothetical protein
MDCLGGDLAAGWLTQKQHGFSDIFWFGQPVQQVRDRALAQGWLRSMTQRDGALSDRSFSRDNVSSRPATSTSTIASWAPALASASAMAGRYRLLRQ